VVPRRVVEDTSVPLQEQVAADQAAFLREHLLRP
jgi:hypothetical protein